MVYFEKECDTDAEADKFIEEYCKNYHPAGYGTSCRKEVKGDKVLVKVSRGSSCD